MKSVNNKIKKPFVSIGFDESGKLTFNVDLNKTKKLNQEQLFALSGVFENVISAINNGGSKTILEVLKVYKNNTGIEFRPITVAELENIKMYINDGQKLMAIKIFKEYTGAGLKDAKDFVFFFAEHMKYS